MKKFTISALALVALAFVVAIPTSKASAATDTACIQAAISTRETALISLVSTTASAHTQALTTRKSALESAWNITDKSARKEAIKDARTTYKTAMETNHQTRKEAHKTIWETFKQNKEACQ